jgi:hypothetical protein
MINFLKDIPSPKVIRGKYFAYLHAHLKYGLICWGGGAYSKGIFKLQNRVTQLIRNAGRYTSRRETSKALNKLPAACIHMLVQQVKQYATS